MADKIAPQNSEAERSLLGSVLLHPDLLLDALDIVKSEDFYSEADQAIFQGMVNLLNKAVSIDLTTLSDALIKSGVDKEIAGIENLTRITLDAPLTYNVREYAKIVKDNALTRKLIHAAQEIIDESYSEHESSRELIDNAEAKIFALSQGSNRTSAAPIKEILVETLAHIQQISENHGKITGISTGFTELDSMTSGLQKSDLIIIAARPSMGKTAFALNIAIHAAVREKKSVMIFSLEMSKEQLVQRMLLSEALVDSNRVRTGDLNGAEDWEPIMMAANNIAETTVYIDDTVNINLTEMRSKCRRQKSQNGLDLIVIDYMQLMNGNGRNENRQNEISEISRGLKSLAREMECPVICLSQLARGPEARQDHRPMLSDLRESGSIEQDADVVMFLYRDAYYNKEEAVNPYEAELDIAKQRNGPTGRMKLSWIAEYTKFTDPAPQYRNGEEDGY